MQALAREPTSASDYAGSRGKHEYWYWAVWSGLLVASALRSLRFPHPYARTHWLFHYGHGFVKRGLPGQLLRPFVLGKTPDEVRIVTDWVAALIVFTTGIGIISFATWATRRCVSPGPRLAIALGTTLLVVSPFAFNLANLAGYFDHLLVLATLGAVSSIKSHRPALAGAFTLCAALSHEMFALFGLPVVLFASWSTRNERLRTTLLAVAPGVVGLALVAGAEQLGVESSEKLREEMLSMRVLPDVWVEWGFHSMQHSAHTNFIEQSPRFLGWLSESVALEAIHPTTLVMASLAIIGIATWHRLTGARRARTLACFLSSLAVIAAPCAIAAMGWDWPRFFAMSQFHAYMLTVVVALSWDKATRDSKAGEATLLPSAPWKAQVATLAVLGVVATILQWKTNLPRVASGDESDNPFALRVNDHYTCRALLFRNSDFSGRRIAPWQRVGRSPVFLNQPLVGDLGAERGQPVRSSHEWIGTFVPYGDDATGTLASPTFEITGPRIAFRLGGTPQPETYVRMVLDGREVHRATPLQESMRRVIWDTELHLGRQSRIEIVDGSRTGHLNVERFCYPH